MSSSGKMQEEFDAIGRPDATLTALERFHRSVERHVHRVQDAAAEKLDLAVAALIADAFDAALCASRWRPGRHFRHPTFVVRREAATLHRRRVRLRRLYFRFRLGMRSADVRRAVAARCRQIAVFSLATSRVLGPRARALLPRLVMAARPIRRDVITPDFRFSGRSRRSRVIGLPLGGQIQRKVTAKRRFRFRHRRTDDGNAVVVVGARRCQHGRLRLG